jgi:2'-5' RNA ligase
MPAREPVTAAAPDHHTGMMVALYPHPDLAKQLAVKNGLAPEDLHVTLAYMGDTSMFDADDAPGGATDAPGGEPDADDSPSASGSLIPPAILGRVHAAISQVAHKHRKKHGQLAGLGQFSEGPDGIPVYAPVDVPGLAELHVDVMSALDDAGLSGRRDHGHTPHMTLGYHAKGSPVTPKPVPPTPVTFDAITLKMGDQTTTYSLAGDGPETLAAAPNTTSTSGKQRARFYFQEGDRAPDGRIIDPGATNFDRPPPLPIRLQTAASSGHEGAVISGAVEHVARFGNVIVGDGFIDLTQPAGQQLVQLAMNGTMQTWSPDMGDAKISAEGLPSDESADTNPNTHFTSCTLLGFTVVALPALGSAVFELLNDDGSVMCAAPSRGPQSLTVQADAYPMEVKMRKPARKLKKTTPVLKKDPHSVAACAGPANPPADWFTQPESPKRFINIEDSGRVSFILAPASGCHVGYKNMCVTPPSDDDFSYFHHGQVQTEDGEFVATGPVALRGGHAPDGFSALRAQAHYDDPATGIMDVRVGYDDEGNIWAAGALRSGVTDNDIARLRASGVSGDWREIDGQLHLIGICSVNTPGFPKIRLAASGAVDDPDEVTIEAIIGMGTDPGFNEDCDECFEVPTLEEQVTELRAEVDYLRELIASAGIEDRVFEELRASING